MQSAGVGHSFGRAAHFRFTDDFEKRGAGAVQVDACLSVNDAMNALTRIFFQVCACQVNGFCVGCAVGIFYLDCQFAADNDGMFKLADLISLRKVRVEIVFAVKTRPVGDFSVNGQAEADRLFDGLTVEHRKAAREGKVDRACMSVRLCAEGCRRSGKDFRFSGQLDVCFQSDNNFPFHFVILS